MNKFILGEKIGMSRIFDKEGNVIPVTLIGAGPVTIVRKNDVGKNGYSSIQIGYGIQKKISKPLAGHLRGLPQLRYLKEFRMSEEEFAKHDYKRGDQVTVNVFQEGDVVRVSGISKGKGFSGVVKRHHFKGLGHTHGQKHEERKGGSIGRSFPEHVTKGTRMAGRMGADRVTLKNVKVVKVDIENNLLALKGAVPGRRGTLLEIMG
jgi:large subunit ribosomal protein L3